MILHRRPFASILLLSAALASAAPVAVRADPAKDAERIALRDQKLQSAFLKKAPWITDYRKALDAARSSGRLIFAHFSRSYARCPGCEKVEKETFETDAFAAFSAGFVLYCNITSLVSTDPDQDLMEKLGGDGYPHIVILDAAGNLLARDRWDRGEAWYAGLAERARARSELLTRPAAEGVDKRFEVLVDAVEEGLIWDPGEIQRLRGEIGTLPPDQALRLDAAPLRRELRKMFQWNRHEPSIAAAEKLLEKVPDDPEALKTAVSAAEGMKNPAAIVRWGERAVRADPGDARILRLLTGAYRQAFLPVLAVPHVRALRKLLPEDKEAAQLETAFASMGADRAETAPSVRIGAFDVVAHRIASPPSGADALWPEWTFIAGKEGRPEFAVGLYHYTPKDKPRTVELGMFPFDAFVPVRRFTSPPDEAAVRALLPAVLAAWPHVAEARTHKARDLEPLVAAAVRAALEADPDNLAAIEMQTALKASGWDAFEALPESTEGDWRIAGFRAAGAAPDPSKPRRTHLFTFRGGDGTLDHFFYVQGASASSTAVQAVYHMPGSGTAKVAGAPAPWPETEIPALIRRLEAARTPFGEAARSVTSAVAAPGSDALRKSADLCRAALKISPEFVPAAEQLVLCHLLISDREVDTEGEIEAYRRGLGALELLFRLDPDNAMGRMAMAVFAWRFGAHPLALECARAASANNQAKTRALEIIGNLEATGQDAWTPAGEFTAGGLRIRVHARAPAAGAPPPPEGLKLVERCWIGDKDGAYRVAFAYRVQTVKGFTTRELTVNRAGRQAVVGVFAEEPGAEVLDKAVRAILENP